MKLSRLTPRYLCLVAVGALLVMASLAFSARSSADIAPYSWPPETVFFRLDSPVYHDDGGFRLFPETPFVDDEGRLQVPLSAFTEAFGIEFNVYDDSVQMVIEDESVVWEAAVLSADERVSGITDESEAVQPFSERAYFVPLSALAETLDLHIYEREGAFYLGYPGRESEAPSRRDMQRMSEACAERWLQLDEEGQRWELFQDDDDFFYELEIDENGNVHLYQMVERSADEALLLYEGPLLEQHTTGPFGVRESDFRALQDACYLHLFVGGATMGHDQIWRISRQGAAQLICAERLSGFAILDEYAYISTLSLPPGRVGDRMWRIHMPTSERESLGRDDFTYAIAARFLKDGSTSGGPTNFCLDDSGIYTTAYPFVTEGSPPLGFYWLSLDGTEQRLLAERVAYGPRIEGEWIYFLEDSTLSSTMSPRVLSRIRKDGSEYSVQHRGVDAYYIRDGCIVTLGPDIDLNTGKPLERIFAIEP